MQRVITEFKLDDEDDWTAVLDCGHPQHVRHNPPFINRPWVTTEAGRNSKLGEKLDCVRCDRFDLPAGFIRYKKTREFTEESTPGGLLKDHSTKTGVWGRIVVLEGVLRYYVQEPETTMELSPEQPGIVIPEVLHHVEPVGQVRFYVEFYRHP